MNSISHTQKVDKTVFIYALNCPITGRTRYVGKANDPSRRLHLHLSRAKAAPQYSSRWINSLISQGLAPILEILDEVPESEWQFWECEWIRLYRALGFNLTNLTDGGDGLHNPTPETREKMRLSHLGKRRSQEALEKHRATVLGRKYSADRRAAASAGLKRWWADNRETFKRKPRTLAHCIGISLSKRGEKNPFFGKRQSRESIEKREATKRAIREKRKLCQPTL